MIKGCWWLEQGGTDQSFSITLAAPEVHVMKLTGVKLTANIKRDTRHETGCSAVRAL